MPLGWAHSELIKLVLAVRSGRPVERFDDVVRRYGGEPPAASTWFWRGNAPMPRLPCGRSLVIEDGSPFLLRFGYDGWQDVSERAAQPLGLGRYGVRLDAEEVGRRSRLDFTRRYSDERWEGVDHGVILAERPIPSR